MDMLKEKPAERAEDPLARCTAFVGNRRLGSGTVLEVALKAKKAISRGEEAPVLIFNDRTSEIVEVDFHGTPADIEKWLEHKKEQPLPLSERRGPGRPKLGVIGREVTLLPRHWEWLDNQPGGASVALRKLVEAAKRENVERDQARRSQMAVHRFMQAMAGDLPHFEEASRAFYAGDQDRFFGLVKEWPVDIREHLGKLVESAFRDETAARQAEAKKAGPREGPSASPSPAATERVAGSPKPSKREL